MKKIVFTILTITILTSCGTKITTPAELTIEKIIPNLKENKNDLYIKANNWMVDTFISSESVIEFADKENGILLGKYKMQLNTTGSFHFTANAVYAKIDIRIKDNAAKIKVNPTTDLITTYKTTAMGLKPELQAIIDSFEKRMNEEAKDW